MAQPYIIGKSVGLGGRAASVPNPDLEIRGEWGRAVIQPLS